VAGYFAREAEPDAKPFPKARGPLLIGQSRQLITGGNLDDDPEDDDPEDDRSVVWARPSRHVAALVQNDFQVE